MSHNYFFREPWRQVHDKNQKKFNVQLAGTVQYNIVSNIMYSTYYIQPTPVQFPPYSTYLQPTPVLQFLLYSTYIQPVT